MLDLPHFYTTHRDRLRKWLPETFKADPSDQRWSFCLSVGGSCDVYLLEEAEASIFLEHAARRVVEERGCRVRKFHLGTWRILWVKDMETEDENEVRVYESSELVGCVDEISALAAALNTLFPPSQEPG